MATTKFYLDTRRTKEKIYPVRINICNLTKTAAYPLGVKFAVKQWNPVEKEVINHPEAKFWTNFISRKNFSIWIKDINLIDGRTGHILLPVQK